MVLTDKQKLTLISYVQTLDAVKKTYKKNNIPHILLPKHQWVWIGQNPSTLVSSLRLHSKQKYQPQNFTTINKFYPQKNFKTDIQVSI